MDRLTNLCPDEALQFAVESLQRDEDAGRAEVERLLAAYSEDPRLHFLQGSLLAASKAYAAAREALITAVSLAPDYAIARYQLGLLELTSGDAVAAIETWRPLHTLPSDNSLRLFASGLEHLARDEFAEATRLLEAGLSSNADNPAVSHDVRLLLDRIRDTQAGDKGEFTSSAHLLLQQYALKDTKH